MHGFPYNFFEDTRHPWAGPATIGHVRDHRTRKCNKCLCTFGEIADGLPCYDEIPYAEEIPDAPPEPVASPPAAPVCTESHHCLYTLGPYFNMSNAYMACRFCGRRKPC